MAKTPDDEGPFEQQREAFARGALQGEAQALRARQAQTPPGRRVPVVVILLVVAVLAAVWLLVGRPLVQQTVEVHQDAGSTATPTPSAARPQEATPTAEVLDGQGEPADVPAAPVDVDAPAGAPSAGGDSEPALEEPVTEAAVLGTPAPPAQTATPTPSETPGLIEDLVGDVGEIVDDVGDVTQDLTEGVGARLGG